MKVQPLFSLVIALLLCNAAHAQSDIYFAPASKMMTHPGSQTAIFGDVINDELGSLDHNDGGVVILYRDSSHGMGPTKIYDGPLAPSNTDDYNIGSTFIRVDSLVTDNRNSNASPSGTQINTASGSGDIIVMQELKVSQHHEFANGIIWTPRDQWKHAFVHYEKDGHYSGAAAANTAGPHIDGYAIYSGDQSFTFPIGDGIISRMAAVTSPDSGTYRAAYFSQNAQLGTAGISGTSAGSGPLANSIDKISTQEFWDIDGTASTFITLSALNDTATNNYSNWALDFPHIYNDPNYEVGIAGWDDWEYLGTNSSTNDIYSTDFYTSNVAVNPDSLGMNGNPYSAFTWAAYIKSYLAIEDLSFAAVEKDCHAELNWNTLEENGTEFLYLLRSQDGQAMERIAKIDMMGNTNGWTSYEYDDMDVLSNHRYEYALEIFYQDGTSKVTDPISLKIHCDARPEFSLYPNPSNGIANIQISQKINLSQVLVHDIAGRLVRYKALDEDTPSDLVQIDLSAESSGIYILSLLGKGNEILYQNTLNLQTR